MNSVLDLFGEGNDVLPILTIICATAGVEIKIEPLNFCSLRAARIQRSDFDVFLLSEVGGLRPTGKSFRFVRACARSCM